MKPRVVLAALLAIYVARLALTWRVFNEVSDEEAHLVGGLEYLERGTYAYEPQHPPLARVVVASLPYYLAGLRWNGHSLWGEGAWGRRDVGYYWRTLSLARAGNLLFGVLAFALVYLWSRRLYGPWPGVAACALLTCCPTFLAHSSLATLDAASAATLLLAAWCFWQCSQKPGWRWWIASGIAAGLAVLTKFSAIGYLPLLAALYFLTARSSRQIAAGAALRGGSLAAALALLVIWAGYRFEVGSLVPPGHHHHSVFASHHEPGMPERFGRAIETRTLPAPRFWQGVIDVWSHDQRGHWAYLLGRHSMRGWWYYFPVAVAVKTTLPLLLLVALAVALAIRRRDVGSLYPLWAVLVVLGVSMTGNINIGVRHVLAVYPFFAILAAGLFSDLARGRGRALALVLLGWHVAESAAAHPDYLPYFNQIARGREERFLADSNLDWGQDLARLGRWTRENRVEAVQLSFFGPSKPHKFGVPEKPLSWEPGWVAISVNHLFGVGATIEGARWLLERGPDARIGKSIWLFRWERQGPPSAP